MSTLNGCVPAPSTPRPGAGVTGRRRFLHRVCSGVRALGLDVGSKTIGVAVSDELGLAAHPVTTLVRRGTEADVAALVALAAEREVAHVVVGWPLELDGKVGPRARRVGVLIDALSAALPPEVEVIRWDERFSTVAV